jgi:hypothetical protein
MAKPVIVYKSMLRSAGVVLTDPGSAFGFPIANLADYRSFSLWKSSGTSSPINIDIDLAGGSEAADCIMLVNHNLKTNGANVKILADTTFPPTTERLAAFSPTEDTVTYKEFTLTSALRYWRVVLTDPAPPFAAAPFIGELFVGARLSLPQYLAPSFDPFFKQVEVQGVRGRGKHYLGASLRGQTHRGEITFGEAGLPRSFFTSDLNAFIDNHAFLRRPFGFVVDVADSDFASARYVKLADDADIGRHAVGGSWQNLTFVLPVEEAYSEPA